MYLLYIYQLIVDNYVLTVLDDGFVRFKLLAPESFS